jgi:uncharacterized protein (TIGR02679 family)
VNPEADPRLQRLLGHDELKRLRARLRRRFEQAAPSGTEPVFRIAGLTSQEHAALASLMGYPPIFSNSLLIDLRHADATLQAAGIAPSLKAALEQLDGPIIHLATARAQTEMAWSSVIRRCANQRVVDYLAAPRALGLLKRLADGDPALASQLIEQVAEVLGHLPANGVTRAQLAANILGDAHALDDNRPVATLVLAIWRQAMTVMRPEPGGTELAAEDDDLHAVSQDETARYVWARAGVLVNELSRPVLILNLPEAPDEISGEPAYLSLRALLRRPGRWKVAGRRMYICENPNLVAIAADRLGESCPPLICTDGFPAAAQKTLLMQLAGAGARLYYHGDFDWPGLQIGNFVMRQYGAQPWHFSATDYLSAVPKAARPGRVLAGDEVVAIWDQGLADVMRQHRLAIDEEAVAASLLRDLCAECS